MPTPALPASFAGWDQFEAPGIDRLRVLTRGTATAVVVSGERLVDVVVSDGARRLILTLTPDEVGKELARIAEEVDELHA